MIQESFRRPILLAVLILGFSLTAFVAAVEAEWTFAPDFGSGLQHLDDDFIVEWDWITKDGMLVLDKRGTGNGKITVPYNLTDYSINMRYRVQAYGPYGGITFRLREAGPWEGYTVSINEQSVLAMRRHGFWLDYVTMQQKSPSPATAEWHDMEITANGNRFSVHIDGQPYLEFVDADNMYSGGQLVAEFLNIDIEIQSLVLQSDAQPLPATGEPAVVNTDRELPESGKITGTFLGLDFSNYNRSSAAWTSEFDAMKAMGMDTLILTGEIAPTGPLAPVAYELFSQAERVGIEIYANIPGFGSYDWTEEETAEEFRLQTERAKHVMKMQVEEFGQSPAFVGWYFRNEFDEKDLVGARYDITKGYFKELTEFAHELTPGLPVMIAPSFTTSTSADWLERKLTKFLMDTNIDILNMQDSVGAQRSTPEHNVAYFEAFKRATDAAGAALWVDIEIFNIVTWQPAPIQLLTRQLHAVADSVEKTVVFEYHRYMDPLRSVGARALYRGYMELVGLDVP